MGWLLNVPVALWRRLLLIGQGFGALALLIGSGIAALFGSGGTLGGRIGGAIGSPAGQRRVFAVLRLLLPNVNLPFHYRLITCYDNIGTAIVTRRADVLDVLSREADFGVVYGPRMEAITGGENFFLGMQDSPRYTRDVSNMRLVVRRDDVPRIVAPLVGTRASELVAAAPGTIDVPQGLATPVAAHLLDRYFGTPGPSEAVIADWTTTLFRYLFLDLKADPAFDAKAMADAAAFRNWMDGHIAARRAAPAQDDVLGRCLAVDAATMPGMTDRDIRNNLIGLLIGELPTTSAAATLALDELLNRPDALAGAQAAARHGDDALLAAYVFEALRFRPLNPVIYRRAMRDTAIAAGRLRGRRIAAGTMVMASNLSAMFDPLDIPAPTRFRTDRPWEAYILWGYGLHTCFGAYINRATLPGLLKPLLAKSGLRRASGPAGQIDSAGTPFPVHLHVDFDA
ncbi:cytochrome P450 [Sphingomonas sanguinis]|uniref:Cytochrome P450 n=1 Tax=Sphingomonas sanguinis TaxID=33051 RepID=A0A147JBQ0_9SPHN|nr:cytochrome P450 [Sphingomonas sanguinis]KTW16879.1 cytochrome P450 [Sphingomonas sanguinis]